MLPLSQAACSTYCSYYETDNLAQLLSLMGEMSFDRRRMRHSTVAFPSWDSVTCPSRIVKAVQPLLSLVGGNTAWTSYKWWTQQMV